MRCDQQNMRRREGIGFGAVYMATEGGRGETLDGGSS